MLARVNYVAHATQNDLAKNLSFFFLSLDAHVVAPPPNSGGLNGMAQVFIFHYSKARKNISEIFFSILDARLFPTYTDVGAEGTSFSRSLRKKTSLPSKAVVEADA